MFILLPFFTLLLPYVLLADETLPSPMLSCSGTQLTQNKCGTVACHDARCLTCSSISISDCLLCATGYKVSRLSPGSGSCLKACTGSQVTTDHYNQTIAHTFSGTDDVCSSDPTANCTDTNCLSCILGSPDLCVICKPGLYPIYNASANTSICSSCAGPGGILKCASCYWNTYCYQCQAGDTNTGSAGYLLAGNGKGCTVCARAFIRCGNCDGSNTCISCASGYFLSGGKCAPCPRFCDVCSDKSTCTACRSGFYLASPSSCVLCGLTFPGCISCKDNTQCNSCRTSYYLDSPTSCSLCTSTPGAIKCNGKNILRCGDNTTINSAGNDCLPCSQTPNCAYCNGTTCLYCRAGYLLSSSYQCLPDSSIPYCSKSDGKYCVICLPEYYIVKDPLTGNSTCNNCSQIPNCSTCDGVSCGSCQSNYYLSTPTQCSPCSSFGNCSYCDGKTCVQCLPGYFLYDDSGTYSCFSCGDPLRGIDRCLSCWDQNKCRLCQAGYVLDSNSHCTAIWNIKNCLQGNGISCTACYAGYYLKEGMCYSCQDSECQVCSYDPVTAGSLCGLCRAGNYLNPMTLGCVPCMQNIRGGNCVLCDYTQAVSGDYAFTCSLCTTGYGVVLGSGNCTACALSNCLTCVFDPKLNSSLCTNCTTGYYTHPNGSCLYCGDPYCTVCAPNAASGSLTCSACRPNYYLDVNAICRACGAAFVGCSACSLDSKTTLPVCSECVNSYYYFNSTNSTCESCSDLINFCSLCTLASDGSMVICFTCQKGYYLKNSLTCLPCQSSLCLVCSAFDLGASCLSCTAGYYVNNGSCSACGANITGCKLCSQSSLQAPPTCTQCMSGYFANSSVCQACGSNCQTCVSPNNCSQCVAGYYNQINSTGSYCLSSQCLAPYSIPNQADMLCYPCGYLFPGCSECSLTANCSKCSDTSAVPMLPYYSSCGFCASNSGNALNNNITSSNVISLTVSYDGGCAYQPQIAKPITQARNTLTGLVNFRINCSVPEPMSVYGVYFLNYDGYLSNISLSQIKSLFASVSLNSTTPEFVNRSLSDRYWTTYYAMRTDSSSMASFWVNGLMNAEVNYRMYVWCYNPGSIQHPLDITSMNYTQDWVQDDNGGETIKLGFEVPGTAFSATQRQTLVATISAQMGLAAMNRRVLYDVIADQGNVEFFYITRDYTITPFDNTNTYLLRDIQAKGFLSGLTSSTGLQITSFTYSLLSSSLQFQIPLFKSVDFPLLIKINYTTAAMNLSFVNTNAVLYMGIIDDVTIDDLDWVTFSQGMARTSQAFKDFQKQYLPQGQVYQWQVSGLTLGSTYALYIGATNEDEFPTSLRTSIQRVIFRPKNQAFMPTVNG